MGRGRIARRPGWHAVELFVVLGERDYHEGRGRKAGAKFCAVIAFLHDDRNQRLDYIFKAWAPNASTGKCDFKSRKKLDKFASVHSCVTNKMNKFFTRSEKRDPDKYGFRSIDLNPRSDTHNYTLSRCHATPVGIGAPVPTNGTRAIDFRTELGVKMEDAWLEKRTIFED